MAEREGFEPPIPFRVCALSRRVPSATRPSLRATGQNRFYQSVCISRFPRSVANCRCGTLLRAVFKRSSMA